MDVDVVVVVVVFCCFVVAVVGVFAAIAFVIVVVEEDDDDGYCCGIVLTRRGPAPIDILPVPSPLDKDNMRIGCTLSTKARMFVSRTKSTVARPTAIRITT